MCAVKVLGPKDGDDGIVSYLLESKANINMQDVMGDTALHIACCSKVPSPALSLFPTARELLICTESLFTMMTLIFFWLRARPAVPQDPSNPLLPKGFDKLTQVLIDAKADVNICNKIGQTALHRASQVLQHADLGCMWRTHVAGEVHRACIACLHRVSHVLRDGMHNG